MSLELSDNVGRTGKIEDVVLVQVLLKQIKDRAGNAYWLNPIDGLGSSALVKAIETFQSEKRERGVEIPERELGVVSRWSRTWDLLKEGAPGEFKNIKVIKIGNIPYIYFIKRFSGVINKYREEVINKKSAFSRILSQNTRTLLSRRIVEISDLYGISVKLVSSYIVSGHVFVNLIPVNLKIINSFGKILEVDGVSIKVPEFVWSLLDEQFKLFMEAIKNNENGNRVYKINESIEVLKKNLDYQSLMLRFEVKSDGYDTKLIGSALYLIKKIDELSPEEIDNLNQIISFISLEKSKISEELERLKNYMKGGILKRNLRYRDVYEQHLYVKQLGEWDKFLKAISLGIIISGSIADYSKLIEGLKKGTKIAVSLSNLYAGFLLIMEVLITGSTNVTSSLAKKRREYINSGNSSFNGTTLSENHTDGLLSLFEINKDNFNKINETDKKKVIEIMKYVILNPTGQFNEIANKIEIDLTLLGMKYNSVIVQIRKFRNLNREPITATNAKFKPDSELFAFEKSMNESSYFVSLISPLTSLKDISKAANLAESIENSGPFIEFLRSEYSDSIKSNIDKIISESNGVPPNF
ncbi:MAG: hypothetical protein HQ481_00235 [Alphaproteobacteria bacterium]|nr:hypothetical protein [Alphaproteobacteria bacterium]